MSNKGLATYYLKKKDVFFIFWLTNIYQIAVPIQENDQNSMCYYVLIHLTIYLHLLTVKMMKQRSVGEVW